MSHPALSPHNVAVVTGGASGLGLAAAMRFARLGMKVCIADLGADRLADAAAKLSSVAPGRGSDIMAISADVSRSVFIKGSRSIAAATLTGSAPNANRAPCTI